MHIKKTIALNLIIISALTSCQHQIHDIYEPYPEKYNHPIIKEETFINTKVKTPVAVNAAPAPKPIEVKSDNYYNYWGRYIY